MRKIVWSICRFGFALCNRILSSSNAIGLDLRAGAVYRFSLAPFKYNTEVCHLEKYAAWAWSRGLVGIIFYPRGLWGMRPHLSPVTIYTLLHHKVLPVTHAHLDIRTHTSFSHLMPNSNLPYEPPDGSAPSRLNTCTRTFNHLEAAQATYKSI